jgi:hypothetical protein
MQAVRAANRALPRSPRGDPLPAGLCVQRCRRAASQARGRQNRIHLKEPSLTRGQIGQAFWRSLFPRRQMTPGQSSTPASA